VTRRVHASGLIAGLVLVAAAGSGTRAGAQTPLEQVVERARDAWLAHAARALVEYSDTVRLRIPGVAVSAAVRPGQAARLLARYFETTEEAGFELRGIRHVGADHAYAELLRRFVVRGTDDEREETVFFGFRVIGGEWRLREVRITP